MTPEALLDTRETSLRAVDGTVWHVPRRVSRRLRERIKARFDTEGIEIPFAQQTVWFRGAEAPAAG